MRTSPRRREGLARKLFRFAVPRVIGFRPLRFLDPLANVVQTNAYRLRYLAWYNAQNVERRLLRTPQRLDHDNRFLLYHELLRTRHLDQGPINYLEFGVATGTTIRWWANANRHPESRFLGFDTFQGLPEPWAGAPAGAFTTHGAVPDIPDPRCRFVPGMFQTTLAAELGATSIANAHTLVHLDADLYSSTLFVLTTLDPYLKPGDIFIFDEFAHVNHEFRAFLDYQAATGRRLDLVTAVNCGDIIAFEAPPAADA